MKSFIILSLLFSSFMTLAQVRTGGGVKDDPAHVLPDSEETRSEMSRSAKLIREYTTHLKNREKECRSEGHRYLEIDPNIMDVYLKLSVLKNSFVADNKCADITIYFKCLQDKGAKVKLKSLLKDKKVIPYMQQQYKITAPEAENILQFFKGLDKGCVKGSSGCEM